MSNTTITLANSIEFARSRIHYEGLTNGTNSEPAITSANMVLQTMLSAPFKWAWNRTSLILQLQANQQDYTGVSASTFGYAEKATIQLSNAITGVAASGGTVTYTVAALNSNTLNNAFVVGSFATITGLTNSTYNLTRVPITAVTATTFSVAHSGTLSQTPDSGIAVSGKIFEIAVKNTEPFAESLDPQQPGSISIQGNDNAGNISIRTMGVPNRSYQLILTYQNFPALFTSTSGTWAPIPDYLSYIYQKGFVAMAFEFGDDPRAQQEKIAFAAALLSASDGLTQSEKDIFLSQYLTNPNQTNFRTLTTQQGTQARGQF